MYLTINSLVRKHEFYFTSIIKSVTFMQLLKKNLTFFSKKSKICSYQHFISVIRKRDIIFSRGGMVFHAEMSELCRAFKCHKKFKKAKFYSGFSYF